MKKWFIVTMVLLICFSTARDYCLSEESCRQGEKCPSKTLDTIHTILVLKNEDFPNKKKVIVSAIEYLKKSQNADGGWGEKKGNKSDGKITAEIIIGLQNFKDDYNLRYTLRKAIDYISSLKAQDGSRSSKP